MKNPVKALLSRNGSALVGVVVIAVILSIGAVAYASIVRNVVANETLTLDDTEARLRAETGLHLAAHWLEIASNWEAALKKSEAAPCTLNLSNKLKCKVLMYPITGRTNWMKIKAQVSQVEDVTGNVRVLPYTKEVSMELNMRSRGSGYPAGFVNNLSPDAFDNSDYAGLHHRSNFFGPFHSNTPILLGPRSFEFTSGSGGTADSKNLPYGVRFYGTVTTWADWEKLPENATALNRWKTMEGIIGQNKDGVTYGKSSATGNDYSLGVLTQGTSATIGGKNSVITNNMLDKVFKGDYNYSKNKVEMEFDPMTVASPITKTLTATTNSGSNNYTDSRGIDETRDGVNYKTPTIRFGVDSDGKTYYYFNPSGPVTTNSTGTTVDSGLTKNYYKSGDNDNVIIYAGTPPTSGSVTPTTLTETFNLTVEGGSKLGGKVTIVTGENKDINFDLTKGNISYDGVAAASSITRPASSSSSRDKNTIHLTNTGSGVDEVQQLLAWNNVRVDAGEARGKENGFDLSVPGSKAYSGATAVKSIFAFYSGGNINLNVLSPATTKATESTNEEKIITGQLFATYKTDGKVGIPVKGHNRVHVVGAVGMNMWWNDDAGYIGTTQVQKTCTSANPTASSLENGQTICRDGKSYTTSNCSGTGNARKCTENPVMETVNSYDGDQRGSIRTYYDKRAVSAPALSYSEWKLKQDASGKYTLEKLGGVNSAGTTVGVGSPIFLGTRNWKESGF